MLTGNGDNPAAICDNCIFVLYCGGCDDDDCKMKTCNYYQKVKLHRKEALDNDEW